MTGHQREQQANLKNRFAALLGKTDEAPPPAKSAAPVKAAPVKKAADKPARRPPGAPRPARPAPTPKPAAPAATMPIRQDTTDEARPKRLMVPLSVDEDKALKEYRLADGFAAAARVRAMLQLYRTDERFRRRVDDTARQMR
ncbi:hypothetical protein [Krasilnikovia sp. M28-CT-15]|uniref:hypothetical protein n=1 Tax=Krasilnikovia sp. M28-CT-15 TaxID=3373540 RepID=UPI003876AC78